jgi:hypothetical protein
MELSNLAFDWNGDIGSFRELADFNDIGIFDMLPIKILYPAREETDTTVETTPINWFL